MLPIIIDVEASGLGQDSYPIEVGLVLPDGTAHCFLLSPERGWRSWEPAAEAVHGISRDTLLSYGRPAEEVARRLNGLVRHKTVYSDAWAFDSSWLGKLYDAVHLEQQFRVAALHELLNERQRHAWNETRIEVTRDLALPRHRASGDARILRETLARVQRLAA